MNDEVENKNLECIFQCLTVVCKDIRENQFLPVWKCE